MRDLYSELPASSDGAASLTMLVEQGYELEDSFLHQISATMRKLTKFVGAGGPVLKILDFDSLLLVRRIFYDPEQIHTND
ncbi:hypothetical protein OK016_03525 [Vibrio chagasii]|nr:hypothetical protein [Vibrio chagasii]